MAERDRKLFILETKLCLIIIKGVLQEIEYESENERKEYEKEKESQICGKLTLC